MGDKAQRLRQEFEELHEQEIEFRKKLQDIQEKMKEQEKSRFSREEVELREFTEAPTLRFKTAKREKSGPEKNQNAEKDYGLRRDEPGPPEAPECPDRNLDMMKERPFESFGSLDFVFIVEPKSNVRKTLDDQITSEVVEDKKKDEHGTNEDKKKRTRIRRYVEDTIFCCCCCWLFL